MVTEVRYTHVFRLAFAVTDSHHFFVLIFKKRIFKKYIELILKRAGICFHDVMMSSFSNSTFFKVETR